MAEAGKAPNYFMYFPDDYRWSAEMMALLSATPYGGPEIAEIDRAGRKLRDQHCQRDYLTHAGEVMADWFAQKL